MEHLPPCNAPPLAGIIERLLPKVEPFVTHTFDGGVTEVFAAFECMHHSGTTGCIRPVVTLAKE